MKTLTPLLLLTGLLLTACASEPAGPSHPAGGGHHHNAGSADGERTVSQEAFLFLPYDADHDHRITKAELNAAIAGSWQQLAQGRQAVGVLTIRDWCAGVYGAPDLVFGPLEFDPRDTGSVTRDDFARVLTHKFEMLDANQDGVLEPREFMISGRAVGESPRSGGGTPGDSGGGSGRRHRGGGSSGMGGGSY
jgi:uncharacterized membrane protein YgcG